MTFLDREKSTSKSGVAIDLTLIARICEAAIGRRVGDVSKQPVLAAAYRCREAPFRVAVTIKKIAAATVIMTLGFIFRQRVYAVPKFAE